MQTKLTTSQQRAYDSLDFYFRIGLSGIGKVDGISPRTMPLLVGASGSGKTHIVAKMAKSYGLPFFTINTSNWIVRGAKQDSQITFDLLRKFLENNQSGVIFLDELNKLRKNHTDTTAWSSDVFSELLALLDRDERLMNMGIEKNLMEKLQRHFMIIGAGAFHEEWLKTTHERISIGFGLQEAEEVNREEEFIRAVQSQDVVPEELINRFSDRLIVIMPPSEKEFGERISSIRATLSLPPLVEQELQQLSRAAVSSGKMMRWLEGYVLTCLEEIPKSTLHELGTPLAQNTPLADDFEQTAPSKITRIDPKKQALRNAAWDDYVLALNNLSRCSQQLSVRLHAVVLSDGSSVEKRRKSICGILEVEKQATRLHEQRQESPVFIQSLSQLAKESLRINHRTITDGERAIAARNVNNDSRAISLGMPELIALCGTDAQWGEIANLAVDFTLYTSRVDFYYRELRAIDPLDRVD